MNGKTAIDGLSVDKMLAFGDPSFEAAAAPGAGSCSSRTSPTNPVGVGRYRGHRDEMLAAWRRDIKELAQYPNVMVKLGGLGSFLAGFASYGAQPPAPVSQLSAEWHPYIDACVEMFGVERCMFESNYPVDSGSGSYGAIWNVFKQITNGCSADERSALFAKTAAVAYRLELSEMPLLRGPALAAE